MRLTSLRPAILPAIFSLILMLFPVPPAISGVFTVAPVGAVFSPGKKMVSLTVTNDGDLAALLQLELFEWEKPEGKDLLKATNAVIAAPPVFTIPPGRSQVIRLALKSPPASGAEKAYRLFITEVPTKIDGAGGMVNVAMRLSLPVFVSPATPVKEAVWKIRKEEGDKALLTLVNSGNVHAQIGTVHILRCGGKDDVVYESKMAEYVFPGQSKSWNIAFNSPVPEDCPLTMVVESVEGRRETPLQRETLLRP
jgi:fimbrial chaperone protein